MPKSFGCMFPGTLVLILPPLPCYPLAKKSLAFNATSQAWSVPSTLPGSSLKNATSQAAPRGVLPYVFQESGNLYFKQQPQKSQVFWGRIWRNVALKDLFFISKYTVSNFPSCLRLFSTNDDILQL